MGEKSIESAVEKSWDFNYFRVAQFREVNGASEKLYRVLSCPNWVNVLALTESREVVLVSQFRYAVNRNTLELPGGIVDGGADSLDAAKQELLEETGFSSPNWHCLGKYRPNPALQDNYVTAYLCMSASQTSAPLPDERTSVVLMPLSEALLQLMDGELSQSFAFASFYLAQARGLL